MSAQLPAPHAGGHGQAGFVVTAAEHVVIQSGAFAARYSLFGSFGLLLQLGYSLHGGVGFILPAGAGGSLVAAIVRTVLLKLFCRRYLPCFATAAAAASQPNFAANFVPLHFSCPPPFENFFRLMPKGFFIRPLFTQKRRPARGRPSEKHPCQMRLRSLTRSKMWSGLLPSS